MMWACVCMRAQSSVGGRKYILQKFKIETIALEDERPCKTLCLEIDPWFLFDLLKLSSYLFLQLDLQWTFSLFPQCSSSRYELNGVPIDLWEFSRSEEDLRTLINLCHYTTCSTLQSFRFRNISDWNWILEKWCRPRRTRSWQGLSITESRICM